MTTDAAIAQAFREVCPDMIGLVDAEVIRDRARALSAASHGEDEARVEGAAKAMAWADRDPRRSLSKTNPDTFWRELPPNCHEYRIRMARAALGAK